MTDWHKKYRWSRTWPGETGIDGKPFEDYAASDDGQYAGRIRLDRESLKKGQWMWSGAYPMPMRGTPIMPNSGYAPTAGEAAKAVEDYWDAMKAKLSSQDSGTKKELDDYQEPPSLMKLD